MACDLSTTQAAACESGIGKLDSPIELLKVIAQLSCEIANASSGGGTPGGGLNSVQFNDGGAFGGFGSYNSGTGLLTLTGNLTAPLFTGSVTGSSSLNVLKAGDTMTGLLTIAQATANTSNLALTGYSLTGANAQSMISGAGTWNTTGNPVALSISIVNTASGATAKFLEFLGGAAGATSLFSVNKTGQVLLDGGLVSAPSLSFALDPTMGIYRIGATRFGFSTGNNLVAEFNGNVLEFKAGRGISFNGSTFLLSDAANSIDHRNGATAQTFKVYRTWTNTTNYERISLGSAAGQMILAAETAGTGGDDLDLSLVPAGVGRVTLPGGAQLLKTTAAMTSGPGAAVGTLTDAPSAGNADVWCPIMFNGVQYWFPCWSL